MMVQEAERQGQRIGIGAVEAGAAEHRVDAVVPDIGPDAVPEQLDGLLGAVGLQHAGAAEFEEARARMARQQRREVEFALRYRSRPAGRGCILAHQPIGAHDLRRDAAEASARRMVDDQQMVAGPVEAVGIAPEHARDRVGPGRHFLVEYPVAQALGPPDLGGSARQPHLERAAAAQRAGQRLLGSRRRPFAGGRRPRSAGRADATERDDRQAIRFAGCRRPRKTSNAMTPLFPVPSILAIGNTGATRSDRLATELRQAGDDALDAVIRRSARSRRGHRRASIQRAGRRVRGA